MLKHLYYKLVKAATNTKKHYFLAVLEEQPNTYVLRGAYGRIGNSLQQREIARGSLAHVLEVFDEECVRRVRKGYVKTQAPIQGPKPSWWVDDPQAVQAIQLQEAAKSATAKKAAAKSVEVRRQKAEEQEQATRRRRNAAWNF